MEFLTLMIVFISGTIIGSFLNVVIYRYNSGVSPLTGRSMCFACGKELAWHELIPVVSFLAQRGRCRACKVKLSWQYPSIELLVGAMFVLIYLLGKPVIESVYLLIVFSTLLIIAVYDMRHQIIPDGLAVFFAVISLAWFLWSIPGGPHEALRFPYHWTLYAGPMLFAPFFALWFVSKGRWLGLGDGKLAWGIGWFLGATLGGSAVMLGFWLGAAYALAIMAGQKIANATSAYASQRSKGGISASSPIPHSLFSVPLSMKSEIPFGPFLILGTVIVYATKVNFFDGSINFFPLL